jgi:hypothetical protein
MIVGGFLGLLVAAGILVFLVVLFLAPLKLYAIHREIQTTNSLLTHQNELLKWQGEILLQLGTIPTDHPVLAQLDLPRKGIDDPPKART